jgi:hypothetical protein
MYVLKRAASHATAAFVKMLWGPTHRGCGFAVISSLIAFISRCKMCALRRVACASRHQHQHQGQHPRRHMLQHMTGHRVMGAGGDVIVPRAFQSGGPTPLLLER